MQRVRVGLVAARHDMPVDGYMFDVVEDITDFDGIKRKTLAFCEQKKSEGVHVDMFVTGLSTVLAAFIEAAFAVRLSFSLWHWVPKAHVYREQKLINPFVLNDFKDMDEHEQAIVDAALVRDYLDPHDMKPYVDEEWLAAFSHTQDLEQFFDAPDVQWHS